MDRGLLRERDFRLVVSSAGVSAAGDFLAFVALALLVKDMTGSGIAVAALVLCLFAPAVLLSGVAGLLVDRLENVRLVVITSLVQAAAATALAFVDELAAIYPLTLLLAAGAAISTPAEFALVPVVAGERRLGAANGYVEAARYAGLIGGPAVGAALAAGGGARLALLVDAATFVFVAVAIGLLRARRRPAAEPAADGAPPDRARDGFAHLRRDPTLALVTGVATLALVLMSMSIAADVFYADELGGPAVYPLIFTVWGIGMVIGAVGIAPRVAPSALALGALVGIVVQGLGKPVAATLVLVPTALAGYLVGGLGHGVRNVLVRTLIHTRTPDRLRGRAYAAYNAMRNTAELAALGAGGVLVATAGARATLLIAGLGQVAVGVAGLALQVRRRAGTPVSSPVGTVAAPAAAPDDG